jgi:hypothetical protein
VTEPSRATISAVLEAVSVFATPFRIDLPASEDLGIVRIQQLVSEESVREGQKIFHEGAISLLLRLDLRARGCRPPDVVILALVGVKGPSMGATPIFISVCFQALGDYCCVLV